MYEYANARIAARRSQLLPREALVRLAAAESPAAMLLMLERFEAWRGTLRELGPLVAPPRSGIELAIERQRAARLAALAPLFPPPARGLVEALVLPLDRQRVVEILRRRGAGEAPERIAEAVGGGAVLDGAALGALARADDERALGRALAETGLFTRSEARGLGARWHGSDRRQLEADLVQAFDAARRRRAERGGGDGAAIARLLDAERLEAAAVLRELRLNGPEAAADLERELHLQRLDARAARGRRDPLGIGVAIGYVAAVDAEAIRLRAALAAVARDWSHDRIGAWLGTRAA
jgi:vacuolar-type H+-ATPase subunit C/Vma6